MVSVCFFIIRPPSVSNGNIRAKRAKPNTWLSYLKICAHALNSVDFRLQSAKDASEGLVKPKQSLICSFLEMERFFFLN